MGDEIEGGKFPARVVEPSPDDLSACRELSRLVARLSGGPNHEGSSISLMADPLIPIVVEGTGRDGTTLMMQLLGTSPAIAFDRTYPFEQRYLTYLLGVAQMIERDEWDEELWNRDQLSNTATLVTEHGLVGPPPWRDRRLLAPGAQLLPPLRKRVFQLLWREFSLRVRTAMREEMEQPDLEVAYYAQKTRVAEARGLEDVPIVKLVPLVRDPRDTFLSTLAFHEKRTARGGGSFVRFKEGETEAEYLSRFITGQRHRMDWLLTLGDEARIVRYETLITDLPGEAEGLGQWLGVRLDPGLALDRSKGLKERHMTASSPAESIGRWKREMSEDVAARFERELGEQLQALGYDPRPPGGGGRSPGVPDADDRAVHNEDDRVYGDAARESAGGALPGIEPSPHLGANELPIPPLAMREMVGPTEPEAFDNPSGASVFPELSSHAYESVFDFGCGCGRLARKLIQQSPRPRRYLGVDLHPAMISWCRENLSPHAEGFEFRHHDVAHPTRNPGPGKPETRPFDVPDETFTLVIAHSVFTHLIQAHAEFYFSEVARILAPTGVFSSTWFLFDKRSFPMMQEFQQALYVNDLDPTNAVIFDRTWVTELARRHGLTIYSATPPEVRGYHWSIYMTAARSGIAEVTLPADEAPLGEGGTRAAPNEPDIS